MIDPGKFKALTFDCYGTLIDWESGILRALHQVLARHGKMAEDEEIVAMFMAARDAMGLIASRLSAKAFFLGAQRAGIPAGAVYAPEEAFEDEHFVARGFQQTLEHSDLGTSFRYPGAPYRFEKSRWALSRRAPLLGEHTEEVLAEVGISGDALTDLIAAGVG